MMVAMWIVIMVQFGVILWLVYDKLKNRLIKRGTTYSGVED